MVSKVIHHVLYPNIDDYFNPYIPHNQARHLPKPISHFLGYRSKSPKEPPTLVQWILTFFTTITGICLVGGVYNYAPGIAKWNPPTIVASLGASAILDYNTLRSPLAQPRNNLVGHTIAAIIGVGIAKAFMHAPSFFMNYDWVAGAVACALASVAMSMTNAVHPPGGATAILACTEKQIVALGWMFPPLILLATVLMLSVACIFNNTLRQYPTFWWTPEDVGYKLPKYRRKNGEQAVGDDVEKAKSNDTASSDHSLTEVESNDVELLEGVNEVHILPYKIKLPEHIRLSEDERELLLRLQERVREHAEVN